MALNTTIFPFADYLDVSNGSAEKIVVSGAEITDKCWNWCSQQNLEHASNLTIEGISIIALALIVLFIYRVLVQYWDYINIEGMDKEKLAKYVDLLPEFTIYLLIGFFIWFRWFS